MRRRQLILALASASTLTAIGACDRHAVAYAASATQMRSVGDFPSLARTKDQWRVVLPPNRFAVLFEHATERPFSSPLDREKRSGTFICAACRLPLFRSSDKFDSGTGWPSFTRAIRKRTATSRDLKLVLPRVEYHCARCGGHQGHVFDDGPPPTGQRWCNNGLALDFVPSGEKLPPLVI